MVQTIEAIVENGSLKLMAPLQGLANGQRVRVKVLPIIEPADFEGLSEQEREELFLKYLESQELLDTTPLPGPQAPPTGDFQPINISGPPLSQTIIEDRR